MKPLRSTAPVLAILLLFSGVPAMAEESSTTGSAAKAAKSDEAKAEKLCPVSGRPADSAITVVYEGETYAFADAECRTKFNEARADSLYQKLGGKPAMTAAIDLFYKKILADERINQFFEDINMNKQRRKQQEFLSAAFGGPVPWTGKNLMEAHEDLPGLNETHFNAVAENLQKTLEELMIEKSLIDQVMAIAGSVKDQVLNRAPAARETGK